MVSTVPWAELSIDLAARSRLDGLAADLLDVGAEQRGDFAEALELGGRPGGPHPLAAMVEQRGSRCRVDEQDRS